MHQYPGLEFFGGTFVFWVIVSDKAVCGTSWIADVNLVVFGRVDYIGVMLFHDGRKKNRHLPGLKVAESSEISNFELVQAVEEICEIADNIRER